jgi:ferric iron reductase protein FhuF
MWEFFNQVYRAPLLLLRAIMANPMGIFVYSILSKWYIIVMIPAVIVTFWVFKGLEKTGILEIALKNVTLHLNETKAVAKYCTPLLLDRQALWDCLQNTPSYTADEDEKDLQDKADKILETLSPKQEQQNNYRNPYNEE